MLIDNDHPTKYESCTSLVYKYIRAYITVLLDRVT